jgi:hypothetical protein
MGDNDRPSVENPGFFHNFFDFFHRRSPEAVKKPQGKNRRRGGKWCTNINALSLLSTSAQAKAP